MNRFILNVIKEHYKSITLTSISVFLLIISAIESESYFSSTYFCVSCHSMTYTYEEIQETVHYGRLGADPECANCHLPNDFTSRAYSHIVDGAVNVWKEFTVDYSTKENYEKYRADMAHKVRMELKMSDSATCKSCHKLVRAKRTRAIEAHKDGHDRQFTCIDCHQNIAHQSAPEEDLNAGLKEGKIVSIF